MKKRTYILILAFFSFSISTFSQINKESKEKLRALKISHITEQLELSEKEAEKFWPIYNAYNHKLYDLRMTDKFDIKKQIESSGGIDNISNKEAKIITDKILDIDKQMYTAKVALFSKLSKIISYKKIIKLQKAERDFHRKLLKKYKERRNRNK
ncbi:hypothetical protein BTO04_01185 [Polaribacter sp. SA4-10]|uniref:sensor of ECF-type sigma factor n=1 Tax=Polaribacter sp. SA4-10 TaxID=754397 RepID=UPI000B5523A1|nr:sensor of ECF-type sigma factor [Polaribacter sp. SA4-10]ARV07948.1 hypothetical protein BTO04_01185 [Polaribacter sp. SA4-10]